mmetsp:Transcript_21752/g.56777  ORF Transcript_21752/g.56777 Transcript_21752/m.56777 type:complete len:112 (-) Transcript_21752:7-342(-)
MHPKGGVVRRRVLYHTKSVLFRLFSYGRVVVLAANKPFGIINHVLGVLQRVALRLIAHKDAAILQKGDRRRSQFAAHRILEDSDPALLRDGCHTVCGAQVHADDLDPSLES